MGRELGRRQLSRYLAGALAIGGATAAGCTTSDDATAPDGPSGRPTPEGRDSERPRAETDFSEQVERLRSKLFDGPVLDVLDLETLDPRSRSDANQIGICAEFQHMNDERRDERSELMLAHAVAAGVTWLRTGFRYQDWDFERGEPPNWLASLIDELDRLGIRPLLQTSAREFLGTGQHTGRWLQLARAALDEWGDRIGAFQFDNEPHEIWGDRFGGGYWGGAWLRSYAAFVRTASRRLKATHPDLTLVNGAHLPNVAIEQFRRSDPMLDAVDWHHYPHLDELPPELVGQVRDRRFPSRVSDSVWFADVARDYRRRGGELLPGRPEPPGIWMTETGLPSEPYGVEAQAKYVARTYTLALAAGIRTFCYQLADRPGQPERARHFGLLDVRLRPKPGYFVLGRISALTGGRVRADPAFDPNSVLRSEPVGRPRFEGTVGRRGRRIELSERVRVLKLDRDDGAVLLAIWSTRPIESGFRPRRASMRVPREYGRRAVLVDPLTGGSRRLRPGGEAELEVADHPSFVLVDGT